MDSGLVSRYGQDSVCQGVSVAGIEEIMSAEVFRTGAMHCCRYVVLFSVVCLTHSVSHSRLLHIVSYLVFFIPPK